MQDVPSTRQAHDLTQAAAHTDKTMTTEVAGLHIVIRPQPGIGRDRKIETAAGPEHERKRLLAVIRGTLHKIFNAYKALSPVEQWEHKSRWVPLETLVDLGALPRELLPLEERADEHDQGEEGAG